MSKKTHSMVDFVKISTYGALFQFNDDAGKVEKVSHLNSRN